MKLPKAQFNAKEHIEIERFAARVEEDEVPDRFGKIAEDALRGGRVIGLEQSHTIAAPEYDSQKSAAQTIEVSAAPQAIVQQQEMYIAEQTATTPAYPSATQSLHHSRTIKKRRKPTLTLTLWTMVSTRRMRAMLKSKRLKPILA